jgi:hypothetical protein
MKHSASQVLAVAIAIGLPFAVLAAGVSGTYDPTTRQVRDGYQAEVLAHAWPDEYFFAVGSSTNDYEPLGIDPFNCPPGSVPKVNQAYVWGLGKSQNDMYFGTLANGNTLVISVYLDVATNGTYYGGGAGSYDQASEGSASVYGQQHGDTEDWRPPQLFRYNLADKSLTLLDPLLPQSAQDILMTLGGVRAGGSANANAYNPHRMVILAGPPIDHAAGGVGFFIFDATTTQYVGSVVKTEYNNIRRMVDVNGDLYFGVQRTNTLDGAVVRWVNNPKLPGYPFIFQEVGVLDEMGADICVHEGRLFCTTWPGYVEGSLQDIMQLDPNEIYRRAPGLWMSPVVPAGGLTAAHRAQWMKVWSVANYEPDVVTALTLGGGALASFDGHLYFGTMQVSGTGPLAFQFMYGAPTRPTRPSTNGLVSAEDWLAYTNARTAYYVASTNYNKSTSAIYTNTVRPLALFRGKNFRTPTVYQGTILKLGGDFELLYGSAKLPVFVPPATTNDYYGVTNWVWIANKMGQTPSMGQAGFGNVENVYTWSMEVFKNTLFVGTYDGSIPRTRALFNAAATNANSTYGADLYRLHSAMAKRFQAVALNGVGNICNYGCRTMASDAAGLYIGTANPRNLLTNPTNSPAYGGWELLKLTRRATTPLDMDADFEADAAWMTAAGTMIVGRSKTGTATNFPATTAALAAWADYDRDGVADPAWCDPAKGTWTVWLSSRDLQRTTLVTFAYSSSVPVPADFDGDGKADQALCAVSGGKVSWRSTKDGKTYSVSPGVSLAFPAVGDYNGDGVAELVWYVRPSGSTPARIIRSSSVSTAKLTSQSLPDGFAKGIPVPADYDGDGKCDFALHDPLTGTIRVWRSSDNVTVDSAAPGAGWLPMPFDYDGDGKCDFAWFDPTWGTLRIQNSVTLVVETPDANVASMFGVPTPKSRPVNAPAAVWYTK